MRKTLLLLCGVSAFGAGSLASAHATPWADANDAQVRHYLQVLADAGVVQFSANTYPIMWGALLENMQTVDARALSLEQQQAYFYVLSVLDFHASGGYTGAAVHGQSRTGAQRGFASAGSGAGGGVSGGEKGSLTITRDFKTDHSAFRLQTSYRTGREALPWRDSDPQSISFAGSYAATMLSNKTLGSWVVGVDQLPTWWSPSYEHDGMHTRSERPLQALRVTRAGAAPFTSPALQWIGPWSATAYVGRSERALGIARVVNGTASDDQRSREEAFGVRVTATPHARLQLGSRFTGAHLGYTQKNAAVDARYVLLNGAQGDTRLQAALQLAVYGELIYHDSALSTTYHTVGADMQVPLAGKEGGTPSSLRIYAEQMAHYSRDTLAIGVDQITTGGYGWSLRVRAIDYFANHWRAAQFLDHQFAAESLIPDLQSNGSLVTDTQSNSLFSAYEIQRYQLDARMYRPLGDGRVVLGAQWWRDTGVANNAVAQERMENNYYNISLSWEVRW